MKATLSAVCLALIVGTARRAVRAEVPAEVKAVLDKAIKATAAPRRSANKRPPSRK